MFQLVYFSRACKMFQERELVELSNKASKINATRGITGMLIYNHLDFSQIIEGEKDEILSLFKSITNDPRHNEIRVIKSAHVKEREFKDWMVGYTVMDSRWFKKLE